jgi:hypothetical protein
MTYLDSTHFSDKFSYKILLISNYSLKDTNHARFKHLQQYLAKQRKPGTFLTETQLAAESDKRDQAGADAARAAKTFLTGRERARDNDKDLAGTHANRQNKMDYYLQSPGLKHRI